MHSTRRRLLLEQGGPSINDAQISHISTTFQLRFLKYYNHLLERAGPKSERIKTHMKWLKTTASLIKISQMQVILRDLHEEWATIKIVEDSAKRFFLVWVRRHLAVHWRKLSSKIIQKRKIIEGSKFKEMRSAHASNYVFKDSDFEPNFDNLIGILSYQNQLNHLTHPEEEDLLINEEEDIHLDNHNIVNNSDNPEQIHSGHIFQEEESGSHHLFEEEDIAETHLKEKGAKLSQNKNEEDELQQKRRELEQLLENQKEKQKELDEKEKQIEQQQKELEERKQKELEELEKAKAQFEEEKKTQKRKIKQKLSKKGKKNDDSLSIDSSNTDYSFTSYESQTHLKRRNAPSRRSSRRKNEEEESIRSSHKKSRNIIKTIVVKEQPANPKNESENKPVPLKKRFSMLLHDRVALIIVSLVFAIILIFLFIFFTK